MNTKMSTKNDKKQNLKSSETTVKDYKKMGKITATELEQFFDENFLEANALVTTK